MGRGRDGAAGDGGQGIVRAQAVSRIVSSRANSSGLAVDVVDANAVISGGAALASTAGRLVTVLEEVCDAAARRRLALLPPPSRPPSPPLSASREVECLLKPA